MKKLLLGLTVGAVSVASWGSCTAGQMDLTGETMNGNLNGVVSLVGQKLTSHILANDGLESISKTVNYKSLPNSNIVAFEYKSIVPAGLTGEEFAAGWLFHHSKTGSEVTSGALFAPMSDKNGLNLILIGAGNPTQLFQSSESISPDSNRFGIYINRQTKQIGYILNGVNKGYRWEYIDNINDIGFTLANSFGGFKSNSSHIGKEVSFELITDHSELQFTYPSGTDDICGNTI